jgi:hypothetical protein
VLRKKNAALLIMSETLAVGDSNQLALQRPVEEVLAGFRAAVLPSPKDSAATAFFPTPPDASWTDVHMNFKDGHTLSVRVKSETMTCNYTQMGMANSRNGKPTKQWELLAHFADAHGTLTWRARTADRKNQKRKEKLAAALQAFFRIEGDPFQLTADRKGWQTLFSISPD